MSLTERLQSAHEARAWEGAIPLQNRYTMGLAGERFFRTIKDEARFTATYCPECDYTYMPPRLYCERCFGELKEWVEVPNRGTVYAYTTVHYDLEENPLDTPQVVALIEMEGCDGVFVHLLGAVDPDDVCIGMPVEAVFKREAERTGEITDIAYFRPIGGSRR
jgi:uncharacterized OB-fold protein